MGPIYIFAGIKMIQCPTPESDVKRKQLTWLMDECAEITFQEKKGNVFDYFRADCEFKGQYQETCRRLFTLCLLRCGDRQIIFGTGKCRGKNRCIEAMCNNNPNTETLNSLYRQRKRKWPNCEEPSIHFEKFIGVLTSMAEHKISARLSPSCGICMRIAIK